MSVTSNGNIDLTVRCRDNATWWGEQWGARWANSPSVSQGQIN